MIDDCLDIKSLLLLESVRSTGQDLASPGMTGQGPASSGMTGQGLASSGMTGQGLASSGMTGQDLASPGMTGPSLTEHSEDVTKDDPSMLEMIKKKAKDMS